jgi:Reverse transcriptase (RNA-dependent DNA polymerase)
VIISLAISSNWPLQQLNVSNAFLNEDLSEQVFMAQPPGFMDSTHHDFVSLAQVLVWLTTSAMCMVRQIEYYIGCIRFQIILL